MSGSVLVFQDSNYVYGCRLSALSPPSPKSGFVAGLVALPSVPYGQSHQLITSRGIVNLANFRFTLKKIKQSATHGTSCAPFCWVSFIAGLFPGVHEEEEDPFWWVLSVQLGLFLSFLTPLKTTN